MINKHCQKTKNKEDKIEGFGNLLPNQIDPYIYDLYGNLVPSTDDLLPNQIDPYIYNLNGDLIPNNINIVNNLNNINSDDLIELIDANGNLIINGTFFFNCNELPDQYLSNLCAERSLNDYVYAEWINLGVAWWFTCYPSNDGIMANIGWEQQPDIYPLPMWWWRYPEIPAPSEQWLNENFLFDGIYVPRRDYYLPPFGENIPQRIDLRNYNPDCNNYQQDIIYNNINNFDGLNIVGVPDMPTYTREGFGNSSYDQSYLILFIIVIIIVFIVFFSFHR